LAAVIGFILNAPFMTAGTITVCALVALVVPRRPARSNDAVSIIYDETAKVAAHIVYMDQGEGSKGSEE